VAASARPEFDMSLPDSTIRQKLFGDLKKRSWAHPHSLNVTVTNGTVDLWGFVDSGEERKAIRVAAENTLAHGGSLSSRCDQIRTKPC
jgi:osmotically-inducible protein OsmY